MKEISLGEDVRGRIYRVRGQQVMFGQDLAQLYGVKTKVLLQAVRRNKGRFPPDFMFQLSWAEAALLASRLVVSRSQNVTLKQGANVKYLPFAFTEHGIAMLSTVLRSSRAMQVSISIIRIFVKLRRALVGHRELAQKFEKLEGRVNIHETDIRFLQEDFKRLNQKSVNEPRLRVKGFELFGR